MRLRLLAPLAAVLALATGAAHAQVGIYLTPTFSRITNTTPDSSVFAFLGTNNTSRAFEGFRVGLYDDLLHSPKVETGLDLRAGIMRGGGARLADFLIGPRFTFKPQSTLLRPYVQIEGGVGSTSAAHNPLTVSKGQYGFQAGVDRPLGHVVEFRIIEVGYTFLQTVSSGTINAGTALPPASRILTFGTGLVFRLPSPKIP